MSYREISAALEVMNSLLAHPLADQFQYELREIVSRLNRGFYYTFTTEAPTPCNPPLTL